MYIEKNDINVMMDQTKIQIFDSGYALVDETWEIDRLPSNFSRLYFVCDGEGEIRYHGKVVHLHANHMYLLPLSLIFDYGCKGTMQKVFFHVSILMQNNFDLFDDLTECYELPLEPGYAQKLAEYYHAQNLFRIQEAIYRALAQFSEQTGVSTRLRQSYSPQMLQAFQYIESHISGRLTVKEVAKYLLISDSGLSKHFREQVGCSAGQYIDMLLLQKAKQLLLSPGHTISQVAEQLQFCDRFYFTRWFRRHSGETPRLFCQRYHGKN